jgi:hypothetical protein
MMKSFFTLIGVVFTLTAIGAFCYGGYLAIVYLWQVYAGMDTSVRIILLSAMATVLIGALIIAGAIKTSGISSDKTLLDAKLRLYMSLVAAYKALFTSRDQPSQQIYSDVLTSLSMIESDMQILSAAAVLENHEKLETALHSREGRDRVNELFQNLIKSIRRDLGHAPSHIESKLNFLVQTSRLEKSDRTSPDVSL